MGELSGVRIFGPVDNLLTLALDGVSSRQRATAHNIANAETPGYKRQTVPFETWLEQSLAGSGRLELSRSHPRHLSTTRTMRHTASVEEVNVMRNDGNNVDIEREAAQLAKDTILYNALVQQLNSRYTAMRSVIRDGR